MDTERILLMSKSAWKDYKLGDCVRFVSGGTPSKRNPEYWDGDIPWVSAKDMKVSRLYDARDHLTEIGASNGTRLVTPGTVLILVRGMTLAKEFPVVMAMRQVAFNQDLKALQCANHINSKFLFYWLQAESYEILGLADEAAHGTKRLQMDRLQNFPIRLPPLPTQRKIASVLSAYDDLIENNSRRIEILEEMAQRIYREWFVHFRFPGHEKVGMVDSELGPIPQGWEVRNLFDVAEVTYGFAFKSKLFTEEVVGKPVIRIRDIKKLKSNTFTPEEASDIYIVQNGDLLVGMDGDFHMGKWAGGESYLNQRVARFRPRNGLTPYYLFLSLRAPIHYFNSTISGTTVAHLSDRDLRTIRLSVPNGDLLQRVKRVFDPLFTLELNLRLKNKSLRSTRDLLLPKLISGEVDVERLDVVRAQV